MELTVAGSLPATPVASAPSQDQMMPPDPPVAVIQPAAAGSEWPPQQWQGQPQPWQPPQQWAGQQMPQQPPPPQAMIPSPQQAAPGWGQPQDGTSGAWMPAAAAQPVAGPMPQVMSPAIAVAAPVTRRRSGSDRAADLLLRLARLVAVAGVAFSVGRATAPKAVSTAGFPTGFAGFGNQSTGTTGSTGNTGTGTTPGAGNGNGAVAVPQASGGPTTNGQVAAPSGAPVAAPSGAPVVPPAGGGTGTNNGGTGQGALPGGAFPGGGGSGAMTGTVSAVGDGSISYTTANGQTVQVATTSDTTYHQQKAASAADVTVGSTVRIAVDGGFGGGSPSGGGNGTPGLTASNVELVPASSSGQAQGQGPGAFGLGGLTGTVATVVEGSIGITTSNGQALDVATSTDTTYTQQADASASSVVPGVSVRITPAGVLPGGGFPSGGQPPSGSFDPGQLSGAGLTAADVEVLANPVR